MSDTFKLCVPLFCPTLFEMENPALFRFDVISHIWPVLCSLSLLRFPLESLLFHWTKINCLWNRMNQSTPSSLLPIPIPSFFTQYYVFEGSLDASFISLLLSSFFQSGAFLPAPTLFALFSILLLSGCHALFWVMSRVVSEVSRSLRMMCWQQKCWIIWNHLGEAGWTETEF